MYTILGFCSFISKAGKKCFVMSCSREFKSYELSSGSIGVRVGEVFLPDDYHYLADESNIGSKCNIYYNSRGFIENIVLI